MKTNLNIKSFRVFDDNGVSFEINPITILTGSNSSGKSTVVKAIFLLNSFLSQVKSAIENGEPIELEKYKLDFTKYPNNLLGRFDKVVNENSIARKVTFEYTIHSLMISKDVTVQLVFNEDENDELNNAYLESLKLSIEGEEFYSSQKEDYSFCNLNEIKNSALEFLLIEYVAHNYCGLESNYEFEGNISKDEYETECKKMIEYLQECDKSRRNDIFRYIRTTKRKESIIHASKFSPEAIAEAQEKHTLFVIPILDQLSAIKKAEIREYIETHFLKDNDEALANVSHRIIEDFVASDFESFNEYFINAERKCLEHFQCGVNSPFGKRRLKTVHMPDVKELDLYSDYISMAPHNITSIARFDENLNIIEETESVQRANKEKQIEQWERVPLDFSIIYEAVMAWNRIENNTSTLHYTYVEPSTFDPIGFYYHKTYKLLSLFFVELLQEIMCPKWCGNISYISSDRADVSRLYTLYNSNGFSLLLQKYFENKRLFLQNQEEAKISLKRDYKADSFINRWIEKLNIGKSISFEVDEEGLGIQIRLHKTNDDKGRLLADEGYGLTQIVSILLQIENTILAAKGEKVNYFFRMENLDKYDTNKFHYEMNTIAIEEPEIHLHPKYQSLLADMFFEAYSDYNIHFIIETHSEYLIRKAQLLAAKIVPLETNTIAPVFYEKGVDSISIFYIDPWEKDQPTKRINICSDGYLDDTFGKGFYDEATRLSRLLMS